MYKEPLFLEPELKERIWGGERLATEFGYTIPSKTTGECWGISAHPNGPSIVKNGVLAGKSLIDVWDQHRELFGNEPSEQFPLLTKILDAKTDLSVQVHPDDQYAREVEHVPYGKTECWYVIDCEDGAEIVYGHNAKSPEEFRSLVDSGQWDKLLRRVKVKPGDFFYVPSGTIHAIGGGILILESQQSSDITYRVYDYDRTDAEGNKRELHIEPSIQVAQYPHQSPELTYKIEQASEGKVTELVKADYFTVERWEVRGWLERKQEQPFLLVSVINGEGVITTDGKDNALRKGDHFIIPATVETITLSGQCDCIVSHP
ncbi:mannose-6-phosphate isomerase [Pullulanibacillus camelliae]|uniref:Mannose-6-phosphate isomerase n=1 Tax=Pullulanibacillus camelliae TaxID=1707096 RepID=A0A8J2YL93_9BACL|nr:mannose-6-phosphate isomerase, class I [Pullulanibacillus camelliae]GGE49646.1 mannose-6-phosphate isomerase [Pullulanibacillus camelliae]